MSGKVVRTARGTMGKGGCARVIEGEEVRGDDPVEYLMGAAPRVRGARSSEFGEGKL